MGETRFIRAPYSVLDDGRLYLYEGALELRCGGAAFTVEGRILLDFAESSLVAEYDQPEVATAIMAKSAICNVSIPTDVSIEPPQPPDPMIAMGLSEPVNTVQIGCPNDVERVCAFVFGELTDAVFPEIDTEAGPQRQLRFELMGWDVALTRLEHDSVQTYIVGASCSGTADAERLRTALFLLFTLIAGREVGVGPLLGRDGAGSVRWVAWGVPRTGHARNSVRWCPSHLVPRALPLVAEGLSAAFSDLTTERALNRVIQALPFADSSEVLDVRIPVLCSALELMAWSILLRDEWATEASLQNMDAAAMVRLLLRWAGLSAALPSEMTALRARIAGRAQKGWEGPEVVFWVRNRLVHPPKRADSPEWPSSDELLETWQVATWYLEMSLLRTVGYGGSYWNRLRLGRSVWDLEPVPWAATSATSANEPEDVIT